METAEKKILCILWRPSRHVMGLSIEFFCLHVELGFVIGLHVRL